MIRIGTDTVFRVAQRSETRCLSLAPKELTPSFALDAPRRNTASGSKIEAALRANVGARNTVSVPALFEGVLL